MTGTAIVLREECLSTFPCCQSVTTYHYQTIASVRSQLSIVLELIISLQHTVAKLSNHG